VITQHLAERDNASSAVVRRGFDEKSGERRGDNLKIATTWIACFRKIFAAKLPELPPANPLRTGIFKPIHRWPTKVNATSPSPSIAN
jgi:hypothetical protein